MPVLTAHYGEPPYKTCLYGGFLNLYGDGKENSIYTTGITGGLRILIWTLTCQNVF